MFFMLKYIICQVRAVTFKIFIHSNRNHKQVSKTKNANEIFNCFYAKYA